MTADPFPVTAAEADALRALQVVVWWCRLVIAQGRGGVFPLGNNPDLTADEQQYVDDHVNAATVDMSHCGSGGNRRGYRRWTRA